MDVGEHFFPNGLLLGCFGGEWVAHALVAAGGFQTALDADFVHQAGEIEAAADHADAADDAGGVGIDFIRRRGNVITARSAHVFGHHIKRNVLVLGFQTAYFVKGDVGYHWRAAGAVGADDDAAHIAVGISVAQTFAQHRHLVGVGVADGAAQVDYGGVAIAHAGDFGGRAAAAHVYQHR